MENTNTLNTQQTEQTELENNEKKEVQTEKRKSVIDVYGEDFFGKLLPYIADMNITDILTRSETNDALAKQLLFNKEEFINKNYESRWTSKLNIDDFKCI